MNYYQIPCEVRIQKARTTLLLDHPFFGTLLFRLGGKASRTVATMATDGASLFYNPEFVETLNAAELAGGPFPKKRIEREFLGDGHARTGPQVPTSFACVRRQCRARTCHAIGDSSETCHQLIQTSLTRLGLRSGNH